MTAPMQKADEQRYVSPLRYPGGKGKVANFIKLLIMENNLAGIEYIEPYAGGASVALSLLIEGYVSRIQINDLNRGIYSFWHSVITDSDTICTKIMRTPLSIKEWERQKEIYADPKSPEADLGFATFYLNRANRSGIIARGGLIGGNEQLGHWKMDARFNRESLRERVRLISRFKDKIVVTGKDALEVLRSANEKPKQCLLYLDPPYYVKGNRLYDNFYQHNDHVEVSEAAKALKAPWITSYDAAPEILNMYSGFKSLRYSLGYSASKAASGAEVMYFSPSLRIPKVKSPAGIRSADVRQYRLDA